MSFLNPGKYTHVSRGYAVIKEWSIETGKYTGKYHVVDNEHYGCSWETPPRFEHRHKQVCIEFCNWLNAHGGTKAKPPKEFETKHYIFTNKFEHSEYYEVTPMVGKGNIIPSPWALIEIIHRKNKRIKELKNDLHSARYDVLKAKQILFDYYNRVNEKNEDDLMQEIMKETYGSTSLPDNLHHKIFEESIKK